MYIDNICIKVQCLSNRFLGFLHHLTNVHLKAQCLSNRFSGFLHPEQHEGFGQIDDRQYNEGFVASRCRVRYVATLLLKCTN
jgi:hypothetical protein